MQCPECRGETRVIDSRYKVEGNFVYRRRECYKCQHRFSTKEIYKEGFTFMDYSRVTTNIRRDIERYIIKDDVKALIEGISGGIDSTVCCALVAPVCIKLGIPFYGRSISIETNMADEEERALLIGSKFCADFKEVDLTELYLQKVKVYEAEEGSINKIGRGNLKARTRMEYLYNLAGKYGGMVLSTDNLTEYLLGFWTLHGDVGDFGMIQNLWKNEVYLLAEHLRNNDGLSQDKADAIELGIIADPTDGLGISKTDLDQIFPNWRERFKTCREAYGYVDQILIANEQLDKKLFSNELQNNPIIGRNKASEYKRNNPYNISREILEK